MSQNDATPSSSSKRSARIKVELFHKGASIGSFVTQDDNPLIIGSSTQAQVVIPDKKISNIHAMLRLKNNEEVMLYDLGSEQGTYIKGEKIVESEIESGTRFALGDREIRVDIVHNEFEKAMENNLFWNIAHLGTDRLHVAEIRNEQVQELHDVANLAKILVGYRENEIPIAANRKGDIFLKRSGSGKNQKVECLLPRGYVAEVYNHQNKLERKVDSAPNKYFPFTTNEKVRLISPNHELQIFWRSSAHRVSRQRIDENQEELRKSFVASIALCLATIGILFLMTQKETVTEADLDAKKASYMRVTIADNQAPAASEPAPAESAPTQQMAAAEARPAQSDVRVTAPAPSASSTVSNLLSKFLQKKPTVLDTSAVSNAQPVTSSMTAKNNFSKENIQANAGATGINADAVKAGLQANSKGVAGGLTGFQGSKSSLNMGTLGGTGLGKFESSIGTEEAETIGGLDKSVIAAIVQANLGQIKHCYERQLLIDANIYGKVVAQWTIDKAGAVTVASVKKSTLGNNAVENCIVGKIKTWKFPNPKGGGQVLVSYPFLFKAIN